MAFYFGAGATSSFGFGGAGASAPAPSFGGFSASTSIGGAIAAPAPASEGVGGFSFTGAPGGAPAPAPAPTSGGFSTPRGATGGAPASGFGGFSLAGAPAAPAAAGGIFAPTTATAFPTGTKVNITSTPTINSKYSELTDAAKADMDRTFMTVKPPMTEGLAEKRSARPNVLSEIERTQLMCLRLENRLEQLRAETEKFSQAVCSEEVHLLTRQLGQAQGDVHAANSVNQFGQRVNISVQHIVQLLQVQNQAFLRLGALVSEVNAEAHQVRVRATFLSLDCGGSDGNSTLNPFAMADRDKEEKAAATAAAATAAAIPAAGAIGFGAFGAAAGKAGAAAAPQAGGFGGFGGFGAAPAPAAGGFGGFGGFDLSPGKTAAPAPVPSFSVSSQIFLPPTAVPKEPVTFNFFSSAFAGGGDGDGDSEDGEPKLAPEVFLRHEDDKDVIKHEVPCKLFAFGDMEEVVDGQGTGVVSKGWSDMCKCTLRVTEDPSTKKQRILIRNTAAKVLVNSYFYKGMKFDSTENSVKFSAIAQDKDGKSFLRVYCVKLKSDDLEATLQALENGRTSSTK